MEILRFGDVTVERLVEAEGLSFFAGFLLPESNEQALAAERHWLEPQFLDAVSGRLVMSVHCYVIRTAHHTILVDTCIGNHKAPSPPSKNSPSREPGPSRFWALIPTAQC